MVRKHLVIEFKLQLAFGFIVLQKQKGRGQNLKIIDTFFLLSLVLALTVEDIEIFKLPVRQADVKTDMNVSTRMSILFTNMCSLWDLSRLLLT